jgi:antitoxin component of RelBE/YafQ-DinJ toxin-antitoxin module
MGKKTENLQVRLTPQIKSILEANSKRLGLSMSEYARMLIVEDALKHIPTSNNPE